MRRISLVLALALAVPASALAQAARLPWTAGDKPPSVAGVKLGDALAAVIHSLGEPEAVDTLSPGNYSLAWLKRGVSAVVAERDGVTIVNATKRAAAELGGVRVGDTRASVQAKLGTPAKEQGPSWLYEVGAWTVVVQFHAQNDAVVRIGVGRS
ncbi:MAG: hypothetical protein ABJD07_01185 [Gemmatimonadaceae bacterium]